MAPGAQFQAAHGGFLPPSLFPAPLWPQWGPQGSQVPRNGHSRHSPLCLCVETLVLASEEGQQPSPG